MTALQWNRKQTAGVIFSGAGAILLVMIIYFAVLKTSSENLALKQQELKTGQASLEYLQTKTLQTNDNTFQSTLSLQKKIPVKSLPDQLLLEFEKAETISGTDIKEITFTDGTTDINNGQESSSTAAQDGSSSSASNNGADSKITGLPDGMQTTLVMLSLQAPGYFELENFIKQLEESERILEVNQITYQGPDEIMDSGQQFKPLTFQVTVAAFYMPELKDLAGELPKIDIPAAGQKDDPFARLPDAFSSTNSP